MAGKDLDVRFQRIGAKLGWGQDDDTLDDFDTSVRKKKSTPRSVKKPKKTVKVKQNSQRRQPDTKIAIQSQPQANKGNHSENPGQGNFKGRKNKLIEMISLMSDDEDVAIPEAAPAVGLDNSLNLSDELKPAIDSEEVISSGRVFDTENPRCRPQPAICSRKSSYLPVLDISGASTILSQEKRRSKIDDYSFMSMSDFNPKAHSSIYFNPDAHSTMAVSPDSSEEMSGGKRKGTRALLTEAVSFSSDTDSDGDHYVTTVANRNGHQTRSDNHVAETESSEEEESSGLALLHGDIIPDSFSAESNQQNWAKPQVTHVNDTMEILNPTGIPANIELKLPQTAPVVKLENPESQSQLKSRGKRPLKKSRHVERLTSLLQNAKSKASKMECRDISSDVSNDTCSQNSAATSGSHGGSQVSSRHISTQQLFDRLDNVLNGKKTYPKPRQQSRKENSTIPDSEVSGTDFSNDRSTSRISRPRNRNRRNLKEYDHLFEENPVPDSEVPETELSNDQSTSRARGLRMRKHHILKEYGRLLEEDPKKENEGASVIANSEVQNTEPSSQQSRSSKRKPKSKKLNDLSMYGHLIDESPKQPKETSLVIADSEVPDTELSSEQTRSKLRKPRSKKLHDLSVHGHLVSDSPNQQSTVADSEVPYSELSSDQSISKWRKVKNKKMLYHGNVIEESPKKQSLVVADSEVPDTQLSTQQHGRDKRRNPKSKRCHDLSVYGHLVEDSPKHLGIVADSEVVCTPPSPTTQEVAGQSSPDQVIADSEVPNTQLVDDNRQIEDSQGVQVILESPEDNNASSEISEPSSCESGWSVEMAEGLDEFTKSFLEKTVKRKAALKKLEGQQLRMRRPLGKVDEVTISPNTNPHKALFRRDEASGTKLVSASVGDTNSKPCDEDVKSDDSLTSVPPTADISLQVSMLDPDTSCSDSVLSQSPYRRDQSLQVSHESDASPVTDISPHLEHPILGDSPSSDHCPRNVSLQVSLATSSSENDAIDSDLDDLRKPAYDFSGQLSVLSRMSRVSDDTSGTEESGAGVDMSSDTVPVVTSQTEAMLNLHLSVSTVATNSQVYALQQPHGVSPTHLHVSMQHSNDELGKTSPNNMLLQSSLISEDLSSDTDRTVSPLPHESMKDQSLQVSMMTSEEDTEVSSGDLSQAMDDLVITSPTGGPNQSLSCSPTSKNNSPSTDGSLYKTAIIDSDSNESLTNEPYTVAQKSHTDRRRTIEVFHSFEDDDDQDNDVSDTDSPFQPLHAGKTRTNINIKLVSDSDSDEAGCFDLGKIKSTYRNWKYQGSDQENSMEDYLPGKRKKRAGPLMELNGEVTRTPGHDDDSFDPLPDSEPCSPRTPASVNARGRGQFKEITSESSDEDFENYIREVQSGKTKKQPVVSPTRDMGDFIVDDAEVVENDEDDDVFHVRLDNTNKKKTPRRRYTICEDDNGLIFRTPKVPPPRRPNKTTGGKNKPTTPQLLSPGRRPLALVLDLDETNTSCRSPKNYNFLRSLSADVPDCKKHQDAKRFVNSFKRNRAELTARLYKLFNETVFENQLPCDMEVSWNSRMTKTAGFCTYKKSARNGLQAAISLSNKVCDTAARVRDTLIHEMCHAAVWLVHGQNDHHGPFWQHFARKANRKHCELPVIGRCHSYEISTRYTYRCTACGYEIGRHSKSLDTTKKVCGLCRGTFELLINSAQSAKGAPRTPQTPRTPNAFALFVKAHYSAIKQDNQSFKHKDVMQKLSAQFAAKNKISVGNSSGN